MGAAAIIVPVFNEADHLDAMLERLLGVTRCESCLGPVIVVDDGSTDGSRELLTQWSDESDVVIRLHEANRGKGAAIWTRLADRELNRISVVSNVLKLIPSSIWSLFPCLNDLLRFSLPLLSRFGLCRPTLHCIQTMLRCQTECWLKLLDTPPAEFVCSMMQIMRISVLTVGAVMQITTTTAIGRSAPQGKVVVRGSYIQGCGRKRGSP
jgi:hypothetical protein